MERVIDVTFKPERAQWKAVLGAVPAPSINQTWEWGEAMSSIKGVVPLRILALQGGTPVGVLQAFAWHIGPFCMALSSGESGDGGGPVVVGSDSAIAAALLRALFEEARKRKALTCTVYGPPGVMLPDIAGAHVAKKWTPIAELLPDARRMLAERIEQKARNQITKSEKNGVTVREGLQSDLAAYRAVQSALVAKKRLERSHLNTLRHLETVWNTLAPEGMIKLWLAEKDGRIVGGSLILYAGRGLLYRSGVLTVEGRDLYAGNALQWAIIRDAISHGFRFYNLCGGTLDETDPLYGITKFKMSFGGRMQPFQRYSVAGNRFRRFLAYRIRRMLGRNEWFPLLIYP